MRFNFEATGIGSVPFQDPKAACSMIYDIFTEIPFWPQLPKRSFRENMYVQFSERIPGIVLNENNKTVHIDNARVASEIEEVYSKYLEADIDFFEVSKGYAEGFYEFLGRLGGMSAAIKYVKGHVTGPISYALFLTDQNKKSVIYDKDLFEVLTKVLVMKTRWQIRKIRKLFPNVIIFIDEPYLVSIGSSFVNVNVPAAFERFGEVVKAIKSDGALAGAHCCGNTDWGLLLKSGIDILNFDTYNFMKEFSLYGADINNFLQNGGSIAWGIVPTSDAVDNETKRALLDRFNSSIRILTDKGIGKDGISSMVTSSCGLGSMDEKRGKKILEMAAALSVDMRKG